MSDCMWETRALLPCPAIKITLLSQPSSAHVPVKLSAKHSSFTLSDTGRDIQFCDIRYITTDLGPFGQLDIGSAVDPGAYVNNANTFPENTLTTDSLGIDNGSAVDPDDCVKEGDTIPENPLATNESSLAQNTLAIDNLGIDIGSAVDPDDCGKENNASQETTLTIDKGSAVDGHVVQQGNAIPENNLAIDDESSIPENTLAKENVSAVDDNILLGNTIPENTPALDSLDMDEESSIPEKTLALDSLAMDEESSIPEKTLALDSFAMDEESSIPEKTPALDSLAMDEESSIPEKTPALDSLAMDEEESSIPENTLTTDNKSDKDTDPISQNQLVASNTPVSDTPNDNIHPCGPIIMVSTRQWNEERTSYRIVNIFIKAESTKRAADILHFIRGHLFCYMRGATYTNDPSVALSYPCPVFIHQCVVDVKRKGGPSVVGKRLVLVDQECIALCSWPLEEEPEDVFFLWTENDFSVTIPETEDSRCLCLTSQTLQATLISDPEKLNEMADTIFNIQRAPKIAFRGPLKLLSWLQGTDTQFLWSCSRDLLAEVEEPDDFQPVDLDEYEEKLLDQWLVKGTSQEGTFDPTRERYQLMWNTVQTFLPGATSQCLSIPKPLPECNANSVTELLLAFKQVEDEMLLRVNYLRALHLTQTIQVSFWKSQVRRIRSLIRKNDMDLLYEIFIRCGERVRLPFVSATADQHDSLETLCDQDLGEEYGNSDKEEDINLM